MADVLWNTAWDVAWRRTVLDHCVYTNVSLLFCFVCLFVYATESILTSGKVKLSSCLVQLHALKECGGDADIPRRILYCDCPEVVVPMPMPCRFTPRTRALGAQWIDGRGGPRSFCGRVGEGQYFLSLQNVQADSGVCPDFCLDGRMGISGLKAEAASSWSLTSVYCRWTGILLLY